MREELERGPISLERAVKWVAEIARGLAAAHDAGVVHRDLKPENVAVTKDDRIKILDFGPAKRVSLGHDTESSPVETQSRTSTGGVIVGTVSYLSPEQSLGASVDRRTDVFSLGIVLHEMLSWGRHPFPRDTAIQTMVAIQRHDPEGIDGLPPALSRIVTRCLEKRVESRFRSASDLAFALEAFGSTSREVRAKAPRSTLPFSWSVVFGAGGLAALAAAAWLAGSAPDRDASPYVLSLLPPDGWGFG